MNTNSIAKLTATFATLSLSMLLLYASSIRAESFQANFEATEPSAVLLTAISESIRNKPPYTFPQNLPNSDSFVSAAFVSISDGTHPAMTFVSKGGNIREVWEHLVREFSSKQFTGIPRWIKLEVAGKIEPTTFGFGKTLQEYQSLLHGIRINDVYVPPFQANLLKLFERASLYSKYPNARNAELSLFQPNGLFTDGASLIQLFRGHRMYDELSSELLLTRASLAGAYLNGSVREDGSFVYSYDPVTDGTYEGYNLLRHAGTVYALYELLSATPNVQLLQSAERATEYLLAQTQPSVTDSARALSLVEDGANKIGGNALGILALTERMRHRNTMEHVDKARQLAFDIVSRQRESGAFIDKMYYPSGKDSGFVSAYYPGEAIYALSNLYEFDKNELWLDTAEKAASYLIDVRDRGLRVSQLNHDHWLLYGLNKLYRLRKSKKYLKHAINIARAIVQGQNRGKEPRDWFGSYYKPPRSTPTAIRGEGLCAAYELARDFGEQDTAAQILETIRSGVRFQLQTQMMPELAMHMAKPYKTLGAFQASLTDHEVRIDYVQHNISSLLCLRRIESEHPKGIK